MLLLALVLHGSVPSNSSYVNRFKTFLILHYMSYFRTPEVRLGHSVLLMLTGRDNVISFFLNEPSCKTVLQEFVIRTQKYVPEVPR